MPLFGHFSRCTLCNGHFPDGEDLISFDFIDISDPDFYRFGDGFAHITCLSRWERRDEFILAWNAALAEYYTGKYLHVGDDGLVTYSDSKNWRISHSPAVQKRNAEQLAEMRREALQRREDLASRIEAARDKAVKLGMATPDTVNQVIYNMSLETFRANFSEFKVSRAFFK